MQVQGTKPAAIAAVDELEAQARTPEEMALVDDWRKEIATDREQALKDIGHNALVSVGGAMATAEEVQKMRDAGQDMGDGSYNNGRRA